MYPQTWLKTQIIVANYYSQSFILYWNLLFSLQLVQEKYVHVISIIIIDNLSWVIYRILNIVKQSFFRNTFHSAKSTTKIVFNHLSSLTFMQLIFTLLYIYIVELSFDHKLIYNWKDKKINFEMAIELLKCPKNLCLLIKIPFFVIQNQKWQVYLQI